MHSNKQRLGYQLLVDESLHAAFDSGQLRNYARKYFELAQGEEAASPS